MPVWIVREWAWSSGELDACGWRLDFRVWWGRQPV